MIELTIFTKDFSMQKAILHIIGEMNIHFERYIKRHVIRMVVLDDNNPFDDIFEYRDKINSTDHVVICSDTVTTEEMRRIFGNDHICVISARSSVQSLKSELHKFVTYGIPPANKIPGLSRKLSDRERNVLYLLCCGCSQVEISSQLALTQGDVSRHKIKALQILGIDHVLPLIRLMNASTIKQIIACF
jgi:DNA-binding NarL/FixJ family response regulator